MNRLLVLLLVTASIAASGCTGSEPDTLAVIDWTARDPETGEVLAEGRGTQFVVGRGGSFLGDDLERSLRGRSAGENYTFVSRGDESRTLSEEVRTPQLLGSDAAQQEISVAAFNRTLGHDPMVGEVFDYNPFYQAQVVAVGAQNLTFRFYLEGGEQRDPVPIVGAVLVSRIEDERLLRILEPDVGARFSIQPPSPQNPSTALGLAPGIYTTVGAEDGDLVYHRAAVTDVALLDEPVEFEVHVREVRQLTVVGTDLEEGHYGVRGGSPYVKGDPTSIRPLDHGEVEHTHGGETQAHDGHDDGHGH